MENPKQYARKYYQNNRELILQRAKEYYKRKKLEIKEYKLKYGTKLKSNCVNAYGGKCECCGETELIFLAIDHINGGGSKHRKEVGAGEQFYRWLRNQKYPKGYRVLCHNCNWASHWGICPHKT